MPTASPEPQSAADSPRIRELKDKLRRIESMKPQDGFELDAAKERVRKQLAEAQGKEK